MNVLLFVMSMLMLLALMTYGRLESYRSFAFIQAQFREYMLDTERDDVGEMAFNRYKRTPATTREQSEMRQKKKNPASPKLSFNLFVDKDERLLHPEMLEYHKEVAKNLMRFLYGEQPFFLKMQEERPDFLNEILLALMSVSEDFLPKDKLKKTGELATIDLKDWQLNEVFTKMLKGTVDPEPDVEVSNEEESQKHPFKPDHGYDSLLDYITIQKNKLKLRVWLASPQVLMAVYGGENLVQQILDARKSLFSSLSHDEITADQASANFKSQFQGVQLPLVPAEMLDFGASKTNPKYYE